MFWFTAENTGTKVEMIPVNKIKPNPDQPRKSFDERSLFGLAQSIRENGILQPITVRRPCDGYYELVAGERRLRAAVLAGLKKVPCISLNADDEQSSTYAILENLQRQDLNCFEEAEAIKKLLDDFSLKQEDIAKRLGKNQSTIANKLRLLRLSEPEREKILSGGLTERHARAILCLPPEGREKAIEIAIKKKLKVEETERLVEELLSKENPEKKNHNRTAKLFIIKDVRIFENTIQKAVETMKQSGVAAMTERRENGEYIEYTVRIPKASARKAV